MEEVKNEIWFIDLGDGVSVSIEVHLRTENGVIRTYVEADLNKSHLRGLKKLADKYLPSED
jgi:hypothetical protein